mmetsp:Transcript_7764/g.22665  ORF Transcript_7764/g.22665 Transcript_7764/m.22665 type:complete len:175 (-) Transcript_7764:194-718(-)
MVSFRAPNLAAARMSGHAEADGEWEHIGPSPELPPYCCVILLRNESSSDEFHLFLEKRSKHATVQPGLLTCFGGKREPNEDPLATVLREAEEELGWKPSAVVRAVDLYVNGKLTAWFYQAAAPPDDASLIFEPGVTGVYISSVQDPRLAPWHAAVLQAWIRGDQRVDFRDDEPS